MSPDGISFRWGIPELDYGYVMIPEPILLFHGKVGVKGNYFALIVQLASFKYESKRGKSKPSLSTIAKRMGLSRRRVMELIKKLESDGWLKVKRERTQYGDPDNNEYNFTPFSRACWALYEGGSAGIITTPSAESFTTVVRRSSSPTKEEEVKNKNLKNRNTSADKSRFPRDWYEQSVNDYQRIKGIKLKGPELKPLRRELKLIYLADHSPDDVRKFAEALNDSSETWTDSWTIRTVKMKLAEFKAGKLFSDKKTQRVTMGTGRGADYYTKALKERKAKAEAYDPRAEHLV